MENSFRIRVEVDGNRTGKTSKNAKGWGVCLCSWPSSIIERGDELEQNIMRFRKVLDEASRS